MVEEINMKEKASNCESNRKIFEAFVLAKQFEKAFMRDLGDVYNGLKLEEILRDAPQIADKLKKEYGNKLSIRLIEIKEYEDRIVEDIHFNLDGSPVHYDYGVFTRVTDKNHKTMAQEYWEYGTQNMHRAQSK